MVNIAFQVTVAIPTYNSEKFIVHTINSIKKQSYYVDNIIVIDDHSVDKTLSILEYLRDSDPRIKIFTSEKNLGYSKNWNRCFELSKTKYLVILHHDDMLLAQCIEKQYNFLRKHPECALVGGQEDFINENGKITRKSKVKETIIFEKGQIFEFIKERNSYIPCSSVMFNLDKVSEIGFFEEDALAADELYWPKVLTKFPIAVIGDSLIFRRFHPAQTEYSDFFYKKDQILSSIKSFEIIISYEKRTRAKLLTRNLLKKKFSNACIGIAANVLRHQYSTKISFSYLINSLKIDNMIFLKSKKFYKVMIMILLNVFGLFRVLQNIKRNN